MTSTPVSGIDSRPRHRVSWLVHEFSQSLRINAGIVLLFLRRCHFSSLLYKCISACLITRTFTTREYNSVTTGPFNLCVTLLNIALFKAFCELRSSQTRPKVETLIPGEYGRVNDHTSGFPFYGPYNVRPPLWTWVVFLKLSDVAIFKFWGCLTTKILSRDACDMKWK